MAKTLQKLLFFSVLSLSAQAASVLILNGTGVSSLSAPIAAAGFTVISGTLAPGQLAANIAADTVAVYI